MILMKCPWINQMRKQGYGKSSSHPSYWNWTQLLYKHRPAQTHRSMNKKKTWGSAIKRKRISASNAEFRTFRRHVLTWKPPLTCAIPMYTPRRFDLWQLKLRCCCAEQRQRRQANSFTETKSVKRIFFKYVDGETSSFKSSEVINPRKTIKNL